MVADADRYHGLKVLSESEGGKVLTDTLIKDVMFCIGRLENYDKMERDEMVSIIARMTTTLNTARAIARAADNLEYVDMSLDEALRT
jgi:hypothetical protein